MLHTACGDAFRHLFCVQGMISFVFRFVCYLGERSRGGGGEGKVQIYPMYRQFNQHVDEEIWVVNPHSDTCGLL